MKRLFCGVLVLFLVAFGVGSAAHIERYRSVMDEIVGVVDSVKDEFPAIRDSSVVAGDLAENVYAVTRATLGEGPFHGQITVNQYFVSDPLLLQSSTENDVSLGFHPILGRCTGAQFIAYHEAAHLVDASEGTAAHNALWNRFGDGHQLRGVLSGYSFYREAAEWVGGLIDAPEALAEAFAAVHCSGGNWAERELYRMLTN